MKKQGLTFPTILFLIFLILKLTKHIDWGWIWILSPIWISLAVGLVIFLIAGLCALIFK